MNDSKFSGQNVDKWREGKIPHIRGSLTPSAIFSHCILDSRSSSCLHPMWCNAHINKMVSIRETQDNMEKDAKLGPVFNEKDVLNLNGSPDLSGQHVDLDDIDPKEERAFLWRLDLGFLTIGFLGYMFKYLDQINISNAYVSGLQEDLKLYGNELNYFTTYFK